jgi:hypothetical protein
MAKVYGIGSLNKLEKPHVVTSGKDAADDKTADILTPVLDSSNGGAAVSALTRETWLNEMANLMAPRFAELGFPLPKFRVSVGWSASGMDAPVTGECWDKRVSGDGHYEIFLSPRRAESDKVACTLAHELVHAAVGLSHGHKGDFATLALKLGFKRPLTEAQQPQALMAWIQPFIDKLGLFPHSPIGTSLGLSLRSITKKVKGGGVALAAPIESGEDGDEPEGGEPINNRAPKQNTRMLKCECPMCGYIARTSQKWIDEVGPPHCPVHGAMEIQE